MLLPVFFDFVLVFMRMFLFVEPHCIRIRRKKEKCRLWHIHLHDSVARDDSLVDNIVQQFCHYFIVICGRPAAGDCHHPGHVDVIDAMMCCYDD